MNYHVVIEGQAVGPYTPQQLAALNINGETLVWYQGLPNWIKASTVPEIMDALNAAQQNYGTQIMQEPQAPAQPAYQQPQQPAYQPQQPAQPAYQQPAQPAYQQPQQTGYQQPVADACPPNNLVMAIIGLVLFFPLGIPALIKAISVNRLWNNGEHELAVAQSNSARRFGLIAIIIGAIVNTLYLFAMA